MNSPIFSNLRAIAYNFTEFKLLSLRILIISVIGSNFSVSHKNSCIELLRLISICQSGRDTILENQFIWRVPIFLYITNPLNVSYISFTTSFSLHGSIQTVCIKSSALKVATNIFSTRWNIEKTKNVVLVFRIVMFVFVRYKSIVLCPVKRCATRSIISMRQPVIFIHPSLFVQGNYLIPFLLWTGDIDFNFFKYSI